MSIWLEGLSAFLQAAGITALLWLACGWLLRGRRVIRPPVRVILCGDCPELEALLRSLRDWQVTLCDGGLTAEGLARVHRAVRRGTNVTLEEETNHGGEVYH